MTDDELSTVRVDQFLAHPPAVVWRALTEPELIAQWLMPGDFQLKVGHRYTMQTQALPAVGFSGGVLATVLAFEAGRMLRVSWRDGGADDGRAEWTITWTLHPEGSGTRLFLVHEGFDPDDPLQQRARTIMRGGWASGVMRALEGVLERV
jgi:uncharacterized protein YndB with AHSA1/START domain